MLNVRYAGHVTELRELADVLQGDKVEDVQQEVKVWAVRELGIQAVQVPPTPILQLKTSSNSRAGRTRLQPTP